MTKSFFVSHPDAFITGESENKLGHCSPRTASSCSRGLMVSENNGFYSSHPSLGLFSFRDTRDAARDLVHWFLSETGLQRQCMEVPVMTDTHYYIFKTLLLLLLFFLTARSLFTSQCIVGNSCWGFDTHTRFCPEDIHM